MGFLVFREPISAWSHCLWMLLSVPCTIFLWRRSRGNLPKQLSLLVFGLSLMFCYLTSTLFHGAHTARTIRFYHTLDHIGIYLLIAGTFTPPAVVLLRGAWKYGVLIGIWSMAIVGICLRLVARDMPLFVSTAFYLTMGWGAIFFYFEMARILSYRAVRPIMVGGILYSIGALINLAHWPVLGVLGPHDILHLFVMAGSLVHFQFMVESVLPFERVAEHVDTLPVYVASAAPEAYHLAS